MFNDEKELLIEAGKGGDGAILFRREIYVPRGGPDGGDGGRGGDVVVVGKANLHALSHLAHIDRVTAEAGNKGGHRRSTGKSGEDALIEVPLGTVIEEWHEEDWKPLLEITTENGFHILAKGGNGGWGNWRFRSSIQQAPERANPGQLGEKRRLRLVLKLIADIGLVGLPNAGKSTFLASVSAARPKIADYPFTTLEPQLGVAEIGKSGDRRQIVIADLPGLIEGASQGRGLGATFLRHIERTHSLLHLIDGSLAVEEIIEAYQAVRHELETWSQELASKPEQVALSKIDLIPSEEAEVKQQAVEAALGKPVHLISAAAHTGVFEVLTEVYISDTVS